MDRPLLELATTAWSLVHGLAMLVSTGEIKSTGAPDADPEQLARRMAEHLLQGITVQAHAGGFRPGIDPDKPNQLVDDLEVGDFVAGTRPAE
ncbi:MAG: hypothetical protein WD795_14390 [Woeseia sp.]